MIAVIQFIMALIKHIIEKKGKIDTDMCVHTHFELRMYYWSKQGYM